MADRIEKDPHRHEDDVGKASWITAAYPKELILAAM